MNKIESFKIDYSPYLIPTTSSMPDQSRGTANGRGAATTIKPVKIKSTQPTRPPTPPNKSR